MSGQPRTCLRCHEAQCQGSHLVCPKCWEQDRAKLGLPPHGVGREKPDLPEKCCTRCGQPYSHPKFKWCDACRRVNSLYQHGRLPERRCRKCGQGGVEKWQRLCPACQHRGDPNRCSVCHGLRDSGFRMCSRCREQHNASLRRSRARLSETRRPREGRWSRDPSGNCQHDRCQVTFQFDARQMRMTQTAVCRTCARHQTETYAVEPVRLGHLLRDVAGGAR